MIWKSSRRLKRCWGWLLIATSQKSFAKTQQSKVRIILCSLPGAQVVPLKKASLSGSPLGDVAAIDASLREKILALQRMGERFQHIAAHDSVR